MNKKTFPAYLQALRVRYYKRLLIALFPAEAFIFAAFIVTVFFVIPGGSDVLRVINRLILSGMSLSLLYAFIVYVIGEKLITLHLNMHKSYSFIQINEKSLVVSVYSGMDIFTKNVYKKLWVCDIRDIDDIIIRNNHITFKLTRGEKSARFYSEPADRLKFHATDNEIVFDDFTVENSGTAVRKFTVSDDFALSLRIAQRIFLVAGNVREREARRARFRQEMLERAAKAKRFTRLRDRWRPEIKRITR
ncbi:MAG: hypothetical protein LBL80_03770 [Ruminococcus sp.]|jgi:phage anti-repressor protein|nr:hypothetical protein [Ruminococcus sp.]